MNTSSTTYSLHLLGMVGTQATPGRQGAWLSVFGNPRFHTGANIPGPPHDLVYGPLTIARISLKPDGMDASTLEKTHATKATSLQGSPKTSRGMSSEISLMSSYM